MWKIMTANPPHSCNFLATLSSTLLLLLFVATLPTSIHSLPLSNSGGGEHSHIPSASSSTDIASGVDLAQLQNLFREAIKYINKVNINTNKGGHSSAVATPPVEPTRISGQVNARYPRSELGDVAVRLWNLQEMDRKFGAKARPRFGKRNEVTQDNFIPMYGDEELRDAAIGASGDGYPVVAPLIFIP